MRVGRSAPVFVGALQTAISLPSFKRGQMRGALSSINSAAPCSGLDCLPCQNGRTGGREKCQGKRKCQGKCQESARVPLSDGSRSPARSSAHQSCSAKQKGQLSVCVILSAPSWARSCSLALLHGHGPVPTPAWATCPCPARHSLATAVPPETSGDRGGLSQGFQNFPRSGKSRWVWMMNVGEMEQGAGSQRGSWT